MEYKYEFIASLVKRYQEANIITEKKYKNTTMIFVAIIFFLIIISSGLDSFFLKEFDYSIFFFIISIVLCWCYFSNLEFEPILRITEMITYFFFYDSLSKEIEKIEKNVEQDLLNHIDLINQMKKTEHGPWYEWGRRAEAILNHNYKLNLVV